MKYREFWMMNPDEWHCEDCNTTPIFKSINVILPQERGGLIHLIEHKAYTELKEQADKMAEACYRASKMQKYHKGEYFYTTTAQCEEALESYKQWEKEGLEK